MQPTTLQDPADRRLDPYRHLRDRTLRDNHGCFIAEGARVTERLVASPLSVESILTVDCRLDEVRSFADPATPIYVVTTEVMQQVAGFHIHTGVLSIGRRPANPTFDQLLAPVEGRPRVVVVCEKIKEPVNIGVITRLAAGLGATGVMVGPECVDPYYRRALRVAMGASFTLPIRRSASLVDDLTALRADHGCRLAATVLDDSAQLLHRFKHSGNEPVALLLGHEVDGLTPQLVDLADTQLTMAMARGTDSLNVAAACAICLHHLTASA